MKPFHFTAFTQSNFLYLCFLGGLLELGRKKEISPSRNMSHSLTHTAKFELFSTELCIVSIVCPALLHMQLWK